jgi:hypothetical protein
VAIITSIDKSGPFFKGDPLKDFRSNVREFMDVIADEGERDVAVQLRAGESTRKPISSGVQPARVSAHVVGRTEGLRDWTYNARVSVRNRGLSDRQGVALMAAASLLEGRTHAFRRTTGRIRRAGRKVDLLKGLR